MIFDFKCFAMDINETAFVLPKLIDNDIERPQSSGKILMRNLLLFTGLLNHVTRMAVKNVTYYKYLCRDFYNEIDPLFVREEFTFDEDLIQTKYKWTQRDVKDLKYLITNAKEKWYWVLSYATRNFVPE